MKWEVRTMRSGTSFFDRTVFKKTVFRFWPLWGAYFAIWLVALPLNGLMTLRSANYDWYGGSMEYFSYYRVPQSISGDILLMTVVFCALAAMAVFSHLYNARSANLFGSLPIRREGLFLTYYLAGLAFLIVPNVVIFLLTLAVEAAGGCVCMEGLLFWLAVACGEEFFFYSLAVFCAMFTGHILALPVFYAIVNFLAMAVTELVVMVFQTFYHGFAGIPYWAEMVVRWFTPTVWLNENVNCWTHSNWEDTALVLEIEGMGTLGIYAVAALALTVCAFLLYRVRRLESAGDVVAVSWMKPVFKYGVALCAGLALGMGTMVIIGGGNVTLMIAIVIWGVAGYFAAEMLLQKSFKVFKKWKGAAAVTAVFIALFLVVGFDLTGFEARVPDPASVESVNVYGLEAMYFQDDGDHFAGNITDPELIRLVTLIHKAASEQGDMDGIGGAGTTTSLNVTYKLKNGGTLSRRYYWVWILPDEVDQEGTAAWALQRIYENKELCWQMYGFDRLEDYLAQGGRLDRATYESYSGYTDDWMDKEIVFYGNDTMALLAAVKEDFFAGRIGARRVVEDEYKWTRDIDACIHFSSDSRDDKGGYYIRITVSDTATSTLAAMEEMADRAVRPNIPYDTDDWTIQDIITQ